MTTPVRSGKISEQQKTTLIEYIAENEQLKSGKFTQEFTYKKAQNCWKEVESILNAIPGGAKKDWRQWRKTWHDLRTKTKSKSAAINAHRGGTGGGEPSTEVLNATEERIVELICPTSIAGHQDTLESEVLYISVNPDVSTTLEENEAETPNVTEDTSIESETTRTRGRRKKNLRASVEATKTLLQIGRDQARMQQLFFERTVEILERQTNIMAEMGASMAKIGASMEKIAAFVEKKQ